MNDLSLLIYFADVLPNLREELAFISFICLLSSVSLSFMGLDRSTPWSPAKPMLAAIAFALVFFMSLLIPSKETFYLIAGSEAGEYVVNTPEAKEIMQDIHTIIKQQIKGDTNE